MSSKRTIWYPSAVAFALEIWLQWCYFRCFRRTDVLCTSNSIFFFVAKKQHNKRQALDFEMIKKSGVRIEIRIGQHQLYPLVLLFFLFSTIVNGILLMVELFFLSFSSNSVLHFASIKLAKMENAFRISSHFTLKLSIATCHEAKEMKNRRWINLHREFRKSRGEKSVFNGQKFIWTFTNHWHVTCRNTAIVRNFWIGFCGNEARSLWWWKISKFFISKTNEVFQFLKSRLLEISQNLKYHKEMFLNLFWLAAH